MQNAIRTCSQESHFRSLRLLSQISRFGATFPARPPEFCFRATFRLILSVIRAHGSSRNSSSPCLGSGLLGRHLLDAKCHKDVSIRLPFSRSRLLSQISRLRARFPAQPPEFRFRATFRRILSVIRRHGELQKRFAAMSRPRPLLETPFGCQTP